MASRGLEGIVAARTALSQVGGAEGRLSYAGYAIEELAGRVSFEETCHLLWHGELPTRKQLESLREELRSAAAPDERVLAVVRLAPEGTHPMTILRTAASALGFFDPDAEESTAEANLRKAVRITAQLFTITAALDRIRNGREPLEPRPGLTLAGNFLYMLRGQQPDELAVRIIDTALTLHAEHGMNASTFAARVTAATLSDMHSAVTSAIGTLKGPLHGGANERVMAMLLAVGEPEQAGAWVRGALERGEKVMGFGHRVYRVLDPRAPILKKLAEELASSAGDTRWLRISEEIQRTVGEEMEAKGKQIYPNVDFFSASVYYTLGIPMDLFTNLFACARAAGWTAHVMEQFADNRLIRPQSEYTGPENRHVTPLEERG